MCTDNIKDFQPVSGLMQDAEQTGNLLIYNEIFVLIFFFNTVWASKNQVLTHIYSTSILNPTEVP